MVKVSINKKLQCIVTGFKGFIGKNICNKLLSDYNLIYIEKDYINQKKWEEKLESDILKVDLIFHVGAISDTTLQDSNEMFKYNCWFSKKLFKLAQKYKKKVIYSSSASCYGNGDGIPSNIYGWSKLFAEDCGMSICDEFVSLRYFNVYGPGEEHKGKMSSVAYQAYKQGTFKLFPKKPKRDFVYIKDVVNANIHAINSPKGIYEVGSGKANSFEDVLDNMELPYGYYSENKIPNWYQFYTCSDESKWMNGWKPEYNIEQGIKKYREYLK